MANVSTKVVKVPVRIMEADEELRLLKYKALDEVMREVRLLGNMAIRYAIAFKLDGIPREIDHEKGKPVPLDTRIYRILAKKRKYLDASTVATLSRNFALKLLKNSDKDAWEGKKSLPTYRSLFLPFRHQGTLLRLWEEKDQFQVIIEPPFGRKWFSDELIQVLRRNIDLQDEQRKLILASCFSRKDHRICEVVRRIVAGEYPMCDSYIKNCNGKLILYLTYRSKQFQQELDPVKVCGVNLGESFPVVCALNSGPQRLFIGNASDVWAAQSKFRAERRREDRRIGFDTRPTRWQRTEREKRWLNTYYHALTRKVIHFCLQHGCGKIHLAVTEKPSNGNQRKQLVSWPSKFDILLDYKAKESGISITKILTKKNYRHSVTGNILNQEDGEQGSSSPCVPCVQGSNEDYDIAKNVCLVEGVTGLSGKY